MLRIKTVIIERVEVTGPESENGQAFEYCRKMGFRIIRSGWVKVSPMQYTNTFEIVGEREVQPYESMEEQVLLEIENAA